MNHPKPPDDKIDNNELNIFLYACLNTVDHSLANNFQQKFFPDTISQNNLNSTLKTLPKRFIDDLINDHIPHTKYSSIIFKSPNFSRVQFEQSIYQTKLKHHLIYENLLHIYATHHIIGHTREITVLSMDPLGEFLITGSEDNNLKIWHIPSLSLIITLRGHGDLITSAHLSPDRNLLVTYSCDTTMRFWNMIDGRCVDLISEESLHPFSCFAFSPDSKYLAAASEKGRVVIWNISNFQQSVKKSTVIHHFHVVKDVLFKSRITMCCFSKTCQILACALEEDGLAVFTVNGEALWTLNNIGFIDSLCFDPIKLNFIYAFSSKTGQILHLEITDKIRIFKKFSNKKKGSSLFAMSPTRPFIYSITGSLFTVFDLDGLIVVRKECPNIQNSPNSWISIVPHPILPGIVALLSHKSILLWRLTSFPDPRPNSKSKQAFSCPSHINLEGISIPKRHKHEILKKENMNEKKYDFYHDWFGSDSDEEFGVLKEKPTTRIRGEFDPPEEKINTNKPTFFALLQAPSEVQKMTKIEWTPDGMSLIAANSEGGFIVFSTFPNGLDQNLGECTLCKYFFPSDFLASEWDEDIGQIDERTQCPTHLVARDQIVDENLVPIIDNYVPRQIEEMITSFNQPTWLSAWQAAGTNFLKKYSTLTSEHTEKIDDVASIRRSIGQDAWDAVSDSGAESDSDSEHYPYWTQIDSPGQNTYFPQKNDIVIYIKEGHLELLHDFPMLLALPSLSQEPWWPPLCVFQIFNVTFLADYQYEVARLQMVRVQSSIRGRHTLEKELNDINGLIQALDEPIRIIDYRVGEAPFFLIPIHQFSAAISMYPKMRLGDDLVVFYKRNGKEVPYPGRILHKFSTETYWASVEVDWGDNEIDRLHPWEIYSINGTKIFNPSDQIVGSQRILHLLKTYRTKIPRLFNQPDFDSRIKLPVDFGLMERRLQNFFYRTTESISDDLKRTQNTFRIERNANENEIQIMNELIEEIYKVLTPVQQA